MSVTLQVLDKTPARLRVQVNNPAGDTISKILRSVAGHVTRTVRLPAGAVPTTAGLVFLDYEYPLQLGAVITYTVYDPANAVLGTLTVPAPYLNEPGYAWLTVPRRPSSNVQLAVPQAGPLGRFVVRWDNTRESPSTVHRIVGRADPVVVLFPAAMRTGTIEFLCPTLAAAQELEKALSAAEIFQLRQSDLDSLDLYFAVTTLALTHTDTEWRTDTDGVAHRRWTLTVTFTEVDWPTGYVTPVTVWTFNDVRAAYGDFNAVAGTFDTFADLLVNSP